MNFRGSVIVRALLLCGISRCAVTAPNSCPDLQLQFRVIDKAGSGENIRKLYLETAKGVLSKTVPAYGGIELSATGPGPIEWNYDGVGTPFSGLQTSERSNGSGCYATRLRQDRATILQAENTGTYSAKSNANGKSASLHIYVPNEYPPYLMNTERVQTVQLEEGYSLILPCLQNNPSVRVTFAKRIGLNEWREVERPEAYNYSGRQGFVIKKPVPGSKSLYGSYKCFTPLHNRNDTVFIYVSD